MLRILAPSKRETTRHVRPALHELFDLQADLAQVFRQTLFCVGEQADLFEHLRIDLFSHFVQLLMRLRRQPNRLPAVVLDRPERDSNLESLG